MKRKKPYQRRHQKQRLRRAAAKNNGVKTGNGEAGGTEAETNPGDDVNFHLIPLLFHHEKLMMKQTPMNE